MRVLSALLLTAALALPIPAFAEGTTPATVIATGTGTVAVAPDMATLSIGVTTQGDTAATSLTANTAAMEAVMARLVASGIEARDMQTSGLYLSPNWSGYDTATPFISGYMASNSLTVQVRKLDTLGAVLDAAVADGANTLNGLTFGLANPGPILEEARKEAVADARARAEVLATAAGLTLGRIVLISEENGSYVGYDGYQADASAPVPVAGGELGLSANVTIQYEIAE
ncbi:COG2968 Uncharacterized conserved protein [Paracoccaceae bacterium]|jgi:uncharacterized protein YggE